MIGKLFVLLGAFGAGVGSTLLMQKAKNTQTCTKNEENKPKASASAPDAVKDDIPLETVAPDTVSQEEKAQEEHVFIDDDVDPFDGAPVGKSRVFRKALELAVETGKMTAALLQRRLDIGYAHAAWIIEHMEELELVTPPTGNKPRVVDHDAVREYLGTMDEE